jgi:single-strand DNA-binding protein
VADNVRFLESQNAGNRTNREDEPPDNRSGQRDPFSDDGKPVDISEDDLPF